MAPAVELGRTAAMLTRRRPSTPAPEAKAGMVPGRAHSAAGGAGRWPWSRRETCCRVSDRVGDGKGRSSVGAGGLRAAVHCGVTSARRDSSRAGDSRRQLSRRQRRSRTRHALLRRRARIFPLRARSSDSPACSSVRKGWTTAANPSPYDSMIFSRNPLAISFGPLLSQQDLKALTSTVPATSARLGRSCRRRGARASRLASHRCQPRQIRRCRRGVCARGGGLARS